MTDTVTRPDPGFWRQTRSGVWVTTGAAGLAYAQVRELTPSVARSQVFHPDGTLRDAQDHYTADHGKAWAEERIRDINREITGTGT